MSDHDDPAAVGHRVLELCRELGVPAQDTGDDFFEIGGNSLIAMRLLARVEAEFGEDCLPPDDLFGSASIEEIARSIARNAGREDADL